MNIQQRIDDLNSQVLELEMMQLKNEKTEGEKEKKLRVLVNDLSTLLEQIDPEQSEQPPELVGISTLMNRISKLSEELDSTGKINKMIKKINV